ncbi:MAG: phosphoenolpyruvate carboxykinase (GTP) [Elusimicrobiota bacterium]|jgi:phosphoenolpyruvate carboxykinase (GTP)
MKANSTLTAPSSHKEALAWVDEMARLCQPDTVYWCDGSLEEKDRLFRECLTDGEFEQLNQEKWPGGYLHRSNVNDVARTEELTFICTRKQEDAGITNNWMAPPEAYRKLGELFQGSMKGRTMYVIPFIMGPANSPFGKIGIEITDSRYVVLSMRIMTRMGTAALLELGSSGSFTKCLHGKADLDPKRRFICHFPEDNTIWSVGSAYGGNALLGKKCLALRIGSYLGQQQGWMAEHMLILGIEYPQGETRYIAAAFPSQCGKTNLAMLIPPKSLPGYKVWTVGDDIAWLHIGPDGRLWASNPEAGFFGVAPGTNAQTNPNAVETIKQNTLFTNVLKTDDNGVWWEDMGPPPAHGINWMGHEWTPASAEKGAHPNSRFTTPAAQCPSISPHWEDPQGVPLSAIFFGARRARVAPLICESRNWQHGVYLGATMASETTAAATGKTGVVRRDPMAMLPFLGYNVGDYFAHWLAIGQRLGAKAPKIFHVNWFRRDPETNKFLWPGFGENLRALLWALDRADGKGRVVETAMGYVPTPDSLNLTGLDLSADVLKKLLEVDPKDWTEDLQDQQAFFNKIGDRLPAALREEQEAFAKRLAL